MRVFISVFLGLIFVLQAGLVTAKPVPAENYARLPAIADAALSPDGNSLATISEQDGRYIIATFSVSPKGLSNVRAFDAGKNARYNWVKWANNNRLLISVTRTEKIEGKVYDSRWLYSGDKNLTKTEPLIDVKTLGSSVFLDYGDVVSFLDDDPNHILMMFGEDQYEIQNVYKVNVSTGAYEQVVRGSSKYDHWETDRQGNLRLAYGYDWNTKNPEKTKLFANIKDAQTGKWAKQDAYPGLNGNLSIFGFAADPNILYVGRYAGRDTFGLYTYNLKAKSMGPVVHHNDEYDIGGIMVSVDRKRVTGYYYTDSITHFVTFDAEEKRRNALLDKKFPDYDVVTYDETPDGVWAVLKVSAADYAPEMILYNYATNKSWMLSKLYPELADTDIGPVKFVKYAARDGVKIPAYVTLPPAFFDGAKLENLPFVIMPHGGPESRNYDSFNYRTQFLASRGYGVLQMDFRGSSGYGKAFTDAGRKNWQVMQQDVEDGAHWLIKKGYADPKRICIVGSSYGGYAALMGAINTPDLYTCAVSFAGVTNLPRLVDDAIASGGRKGAKYSITSGFSDRGEMKEQSPSLRALEIRIPILLAHGDRDTVVDFAHQYKIMKTALKKTKASVTYLPLKMGDHYLSNGDNRLKYYKALDKFLLENLGESEAAP